MSSTSNTTPLNLHIGNRKVKHKKKPRRLILLMAYVTNNQQELLLQIQKSKKTDDLWPLLSLPSVKGYNGERAGKRLEALIKKRTGAAEIARRSLPLPQEVSGEKFSFHKISVVQKGVAEKTPDFIWVSRKDLTGLNKSGLVTIHGRQYQLRPPSGTLILTQLERQLASKQSVIRIDQFR